MAVPTGWITPYPKTGSVSMLCSAGNAWNFLVPKRAFPIYNEGGVETPDPQILRPLLAA